MAIRGCFPYPTPHQVSNADTNKEAFKSACVAIHSLDTARTNRTAVIRSNLWLAGLWRSIQGHSLLHRWLWRDHMWRTRRGPSSSHVPQVKSTLYQTKTHLLFCIYTKMLPGHLTGDLTNLGLESGAQGMPRLWEFSNKAGIMLLTLQEVLRLLVEITSTAPTQSYEQCLPFVSCWP